MSSTLTRTETRYSDFLDSFDAHPIKGDLLLVKNEESVKQSIKNLIFTNPGERPYKPTLGGGILQLLFDNILEDTQYYVEERIKETLTAYEPRALLVNVVADPTPDENELDVTITFSIKNSLTPVTLNFILKRIR